MNEQLTVFNMKIIYRIIIGDVVKNLPLKFVFSVVVFLVEHLEKCAGLSFLNCFVSVTP
jgi:hypothetical protein